jgi:AraC-like DNA-binding protein
MEQEDRAKKHLPAGRAHGAAAPPVPSHSLDTWHLGAEDSRAYWREVIDGTYDLERPAAPGCGHRVQARLWLLEDILASAFRAEANAISRSTALVKLNPSPLVKLRIYRQGHTQIFDEHRSGILGTGAVHFIDNDAPHREVSTDHAHLSLFVPHHLLGYDPSRHAPWFSIGLDTPAGRLIETGLRTAFDELDRAEADDREALAAGLTGLLRGVLAGGKDSREEDAVASARMAAMKRFIDTNLADPDLGGDSLLANFGVSRTTLYRDFAEHGGLQRYILERRLHRAYRLLAEAPPARGAVQAVSERLGFASAAHFSRAFRQAHGTAPGSVAGQWYRAPDPEAPEGHSTAGGAQATRERQTDILHWSYQRYR